MYECMCMCVCEREREKTYKRHYVHMHVHRYLYKSVCVIRVDTNAMLLPGRVPGYKDTDVKLLPSSTTKHSIWELYLQAAAADSMRAVAYSTFTQLWRQVLPNSCHETHK